MQMFPCGSPRKPPPRTSEGSSTRCWYSCSPSKRPKVSSDAFRAKNDLDTLRKTYDDQEAALNFWDHEVGDRLDRLANDYGDQVLEALERRLAQLRQKEAVEQGDVDAVKTVISEIESRRQHIQSLINKRSQKKGGAAPKTE
jgi:hypothetical protein